MINKVMKDFKSRKEDDLEIMIHKEVRDLMLPSCSYFIDKSKEFGPLNFLM